MRVLVQRVGEASINVGGTRTAAIGRGLLLLCGVIASDSDADREWLARKIVSLRIFDDDAGVMNRAVTDVGGEILAVSQFTLYASTRKGARPSYSAAATPDLAQPLFSAFVLAVERCLGAPIATGVFGAHMQVSLVNDGPVTIWLDSTARE
jgi:D-tyrosyl-tRNA(Tyr) deacylase